MERARKGVLLAVVVLLVLLVVAGAALAAKPSKVIIITMDQMKPWYASAYDMDNILWLQSHGANFKNATVGQMASETVVSHNTIVSGQLPKHMGWTDEVMRDTGNVLGYGAGAIVTVGDLTYEQYVLLVEAEGYPKLGDYMHAKFPGKIVANFGGKYYQVASTAASSSDIWVTYGSKKKTTDLPDPLVVPWTGKYRGPSGGSVPAYIADDHRFKISTGNNPTTTATPPPPLNDYYRTDVDKPAYLYSEDGRMVPGPYDTNLGGDDWVADAAIKVMEKEDWSAMHLNFSGIDKIGHMWGGGNVDKVATYNWDPATIMAQVHMPWIAKNADDQVGKAHPGAQGQRRLEQHAVRRARGPRRDMGEEGALRRCRRRWQPELVLRPEQHLRQHQVRPTGRRPGHRHQQRGRSASAQRDRQPRLQLPVHCHRGVAHRSQLGQEDRGGRGREGHAGRHRDLRALG